MNGLSLLFWLALAQMPSVQVATLTGAQYQGELESLTSDTVVVKTDDKSVSIPIGEVLLIQSTLQPIAATNDSPIEIVFIDNTRLRVNSFTSSGSNASIVHPQLGSLKVPLTTISNVRFAVADAKIDGEWKQLVDRPLKKDAVAVRKSDVLDHLDGIIGSLNEATMQFQMDGDDISIKREKIFGLIYSKRESTAKKAIAQFELATGDRLAIKQISRNGTNWKVRSVSGLDLEIDQKLFQKLDFSLGKVTYLSDIEPRSVKLTPYFDIPISFPVNEYRRDKNFDGSRISLGEKTYLKGLAIHSQTQMKYRLGGEFRRFQAVMGIGDEVPNGDVDVVFKGDGKTLFKGPVKAIDQDSKGVVHRRSPTELDVDVTGVVELEILVDFGSDQRDIGDRLYLANARVIK